MQQRLLRATLVYVVFVFVLVSGAIATETKKPIRVFLFAGQSNMVGADADARKIDEYPPFVGAAEELDEVPFAYFTRSNESDGWEALKPIGNQFGPELTFARRLLEAQDGPIAIIKCSVGGTTAAFDWNPDAPANGQALFPRAVRKIRESLDELRKRGRPVELTAMFWHQGENDMLNRDLVKDYAANLRRIIDAFGEQLEAPDLPWFVGEVSDKGIWGMDHRSNMRQLREQQRKLIDEDPLLTFVPTSHLAFEVMGSGQPHYHFGTQGQLQHGWAYADAFLRSTGESERRTTDDTVLRRFPAKKDSVVPVFILAGARNVEGEDAFVAELTGRDKQLARENRRVLYRAARGSWTTSLAWMPLQPSGSFGNFGPELSLGAQLAKDAPIVLIQLAESAAQISDWDPEAKDANRPVYARALETIQEALTDLRKRGFKPRLEAVFWHHGENECYYTPFRRRYASIFERVVATLRSDLERPDLDWIVALHSDRSPWGEENVREMNESLRAVSDRDSHLSIFETSDLSHARIHFGTEGTVELGRRFAERYKSLVKARK